MRKIMRNSDDEQKSTQTKNVDNNLAEETRSLQELLESKFDVLFDLLEDNDSS